VKSIEPGGMCGVLFFFSRDLQLSAGVADFLGNFLSVVRHLQEWSAFLRGAVSSVHLFGQDLLLGVLLGFKASFFTGSTCFGFLGSSQSFS